MSLSIDTTRNQAFNGWRRVGKQNSTTMTDRTEHVITDDLHAIIGALPPRVAAAIEDNSGESDLLEIVMDLGREPSIRYRSRERRLTGTLVSQEDIDFVIAHIG